jgi:iron complex transport system permease protein
VGAALAIAGAQMQGLFQNPMASPDVIATSSGAALGAVLAIALGFAQISLLWLPLWAFAGALISLTIIYSLTTRGGHTPIAMLLLAGVALNALVGAMMSFVITLQGVRFEVAQEILFWVMGGLDSRMWMHVWICAPFIVIGVIVSLLFARELDLFLAGEETAASLGVDVQRMKRIILVTSALLTGAAVAVSGVIGFVGLIVPHVVRLLVGPAHRRVIPASGLIGATFLVLTDLIARTVRPPQEVALGIITAALGAPFFLYLLVKQRREVGYL